MTILISAVASSLRVVFLSSSSYTEYEADKKRVSPPTDSTNHQTHAKKKIPGPKSQHLPLVGFFKHSIPFFVVWRLGGVLALRIWRYGTSLDFPLKKSFFFFSAKTGRARVYTLFFGGAEGKGKMPLNTFYAVIKTGRVASFVLQCRFAVSSLPFLPRKWKGKSSRVPFPPRLKLPLSGLFCRTT